MLLPKFQPHSASSCVATDTELEVDFADQDNVGVELRVEVFVELACSSFAPRRVAPEKFAGGSTVWSKSLRSSFARTKLALARAMLIDVRATLGLWEAFSRYVHSDSMFQRNLLWTSNVDANQP